MEVHLDFLPNGVIQRYDFEVVSANLVAIKTWQRLGSQITVLGENLLHKRSRPFLVE
jgi:hypothetical protein